MAKRRVLVPFPQVTFRPARRQDRRALLRFIRAYYRMDRIRFNARAAGAAVRALINRPRQGRIWLILDDGRPVGYMVLAYSFSIEFGGREGTIDELYIQPRHRGRGIGASAMAFIQSVARSQGLRALDLEVAHWNTRARKVYAKAGFRSRERYTLMSRRLVAPKPRIRRRRRKIRSRRRR